MTIQDYMTLYNTILYDTILRYTTLYTTIRHYTRLYHTIDYTTLYDTIRDHTVRDTVRVVSDIQTLAFDSSLYIRYNTAAHVVNITYNTIRHYSTLYDTNI
jgi:hypothetical protein